MRYAERLVVPRSWHVWAVGFTALAGSFAAPYATGVPVTLAVYAAVLALVEALLWFGGRASVRVGGGRLDIGPTTVPLGAVTGVTTLADVRSALIPGTPAQTRPWIRGGVRVAVAGGPDWVLSTRRPADLIAALGELASQPGPGVRR